MSVAYPAVLNHVLVKNIQSILLSKIKSLIKKDLFARDLKFKRAMFNVIGRVFKEGRLADGRLCVYGSQIVRINSTGQFYALSGCD